jgi:peptidase YpeB-like protein
MSRTLKIGVGVGAAALAVTMAAGVASATSSGSQQATGTAAAVSVNKHITRAQAKRIAEAKVPHSKAIEAQSDDLHDRAVWKVTLTTAHGRVIVDVDKRTGKATIVRRDGGGGHDDAVLAGRLSSGTSGRDGRDDGRRHDRGDDRGRHHGEHRHGHHDRHDHDRGDDNGRR